MKALVHILIVSLLISSCEGGSGNGGGGNGVGSGIQDISKGGNCNTSDGYYQDSGYATRLKLTPGQMPSDISDSEAIPACNKGQFVFNGSCYDSLSFNDNSGLVKFVKNGAPNNILGPNLPMPSIMKTYCQNLNSFRGACDKNVGISNTSLTLVWLSHYTSFLNRDSYANFALMDWTMKNTSSDGFVINGSSTLKFRTTYGTCLKNNGTTFNVYDWYHSGVINLNGQSFNLPLSNSTFNSVYPNSQKITCPEINTGLLTCYKVNTSWGSEIFHFDENNNLNILSVSYN